MKGRMTMQIETIMEALNDLAIGNFEKKMVMNCLIVCWKASREEAIEEVMQIELAPDSKTIKTLEECSGRFEAFGYGQVWMLKRIESLRNPPTL